MDAAVASVADGRVQQTETFAEGENGYSYDATNGSAVLRWGDYNGCVPDPDGGFWVVGEYAKRILDHPVDPFYGTVIAKVDP